MKKHHIILGALFLTGMVTLISCSDQEVGRNSRSGDYQGRNDGRGGRDGGQADNSNERWGRNSGQVSQGGRSSGRADLSSEMRGRDVVGSGTIDTLIGTLFYEDDEWYLENQGGSYLLHLGNHDYVDSTGIEMKEGQEIEIRRIYRQQ